MEINTPPFQFDDTFRIDGRKLTDGEALPERGTYKVVSEYRSHPLPIKRAIHVFDLARFDDTERTFPATGPGRRAADAYHDSLVIQSQRDKTPQSQPTHYHVVREMHGIPHYLKDIHWGVYIWEANRKYACDLLPDTAEWLAAQLEAETVPSITNKPPEGN